MKDATRRRRRVALDYGDPNWLALEAEFQRLNIGLGSGGRDVILMGFGLDLDRRWMRVDLREIDPPVEGMPFRRHQCSGPMPERVARLTAALLPGVDLHWVVWSMNEDLAVGFSGGDSWTSEVPAGSGALAQYSRGGAGAQGRGRPGTR